MLRRGTSAAALKRLGGNVLCLRLLGHDRLGATKLSRGQLVRETPEFVQQQPARETGVRACTLGGLPRGVPQARQPQGCYVRAKNCRLWAHRAMVAAVAQLYLGFSAAREARAASGSAWRLSSPQLRL